MPFLLPFAPLIISGIGTLLGNKKSNLEKQGLNKINPTLENMLHNSGKAQDMSDSFSQMGSSGMGKSMDFYKGLLSNNSTAALDQLLGASRGDINTNYNNLIQNSARTGARGGGRTQGMMDIGFQQNKELMNLVPQARMQAAGQLGQLGGQAGNIGGNFGTLAGNLGNNVVQGGLAAAGYGQQQRQQNNQAWGAFGQDLGGMLGPILGGLFGGKGGGALGGLGMKTQGAFGPGGFTGLG